MSAASEANRKLVVEAFANMAISINKAINQIETPVKEKHVRSTIIGTFHEKGAQTFWVCALRLPLQDNRIAAWKFCHVLHKVLREGHPQVLSHSQRHRGEIEDLGKLWCHLREGYGKLIQCYTVLLITKLDFHRRNPRFPGNLQVTKEELESIGENDINNYFQMSVEMFDYMDEILNLQSAIFGSLNMSRSNSMMSSGQCRLAPLIPCIQDSSQLYDYCVKILFKLHASLPPDTLAGHRERFLKQFQDLRQFYLNASTMQYFRNLIQIPLLPETPPNFLVQSDLRSYVTPVVILPPEDTVHHNDSDNVVDGNLVDTSDANSLTGDLVDLNHRNGSVSPDVLAERDSLIEHLQQEIAHLRKEIQRLIHEHQRIVDQLNEKIGELQVDLATKDSELLQERQLKEDLLQQTEAVSKFQETEQKAKTVEEKFQKLKDIYRKLREEHIKLIRQKADVDKQLLSAQSMSDAAVRSKAQAESRIQELMLEKSQTEESLQKSSNEAQAELVHLKQSQEAAKSENQNLACKVEWLLSEKGSVESQLQDVLAQKEDLDVRLKDTEGRMKELESRLQEEKFNRLYQLLVTCISQAEGVVQKSIHEVDNPAISAVTCTPDYFRGLIEPVQNSLNDLGSSYKSFYSNSAAIDNLVQNVICVAQLVANYILQGKTTSNTSPDIEFGEHIAEVCKLVGSSALILLASIKNRNEADGVAAHVVAVKSRVSEVAELIEKLTNAVKGDSAEVIGDLVESELASMDKAIEEAANRIEEMLSKSRAADSGIKLEVNEKILDSCTNLMQAIRVLVQKSRLLQAEIVAQGKGTASAKEFYKRNHQWTEGLISAAKAVGMGAKFLLTAADKVVSGQGKFEQLVVASQEIAASTAQLVVASRVKADRNSKNMSALSQASKGVTQATGGVVATAKSCGQMIEENEDLDMSGLSLHQAKRLEMESQVRVLELEASLDQERLRLAALRRHHYQLAGEVEGWDKESLQDVTQ
ncbi:huntingtin-interacting protein 1 isoform X2 [Cryptotermes secundus]|uniref:huntingtin-interacting protein 1 isoform X2 n=1 Tax=Cryptotermes secundus TaxID=105785 RepID=UPI000CD7DA47|nr:huntingtin-interacting protein 1 isoform X2 [Cryptotermes secundus]